MPWPNNIEYNEAIQNLAAAVSDEELRGGEVQQTVLGLPAPYSGGFANVYRVHCPQTGNTWAVKCFTKESPGLRDRYREISTHLRRKSLRFTTDFSFIEPGIRIRGECYPFLKMRWVEGHALNRFVANYAGQSKTLLVLSSLWLKLAAGLREAHVAHANLQHGNVLLVPVPESKSYRVVLIDYDGMHVPGLAGRRSNELGHPNYQHPQRLREGTFNVEVDRFSHLAIYTAIRALAVAGKSLWASFDTGDNLLFCQEDFQEPAESDLLRSLWATRDREVHALVGRLAIAARQEIRKVPFLPDLVRGSRVRPLTPDEEHQAGLLLGDAKPAAPPRPQSEGGGSLLGQLWEDFNPNVLDAPQSPAAAAPAIAGAGPERPQAVSESKRSPGSFALVPQFLRRLDGRLARLAGRKNTRAHAILRIVALAVLSATLIAAIFLGLHLSREKSDREPVAPQHAAAEAAPREKMEEEPTGKRAEEEAAKRKATADAARRKAAAAARQKVEEAVASLSQRLEEAMAKNDKPAAEKVLAEIEKQIPGDPRVSAWRKSVGALMEPVVALDLGGGASLELVLVPAGEFQMGSPDSHPGTRRTKDRSTWYKSRNRSISASTRSRNSSGRH